MKRISPDILLCGALSLALLSCIFSTPSESKDHPHFYPSAKPSVRWWWFATHIRESDIRHQLNWAREKQFGGVEIAWVYPLYRYQSMYAQKYNRHYPRDTTAQKWLSPEWTDVVAYAKAYADSIGLACDFTFGSAWPVAGSNIDKAHSSQIYGDTTFRQALTFAWTFPDTQWVINHLDSQAFHLFAAPVAKALRPALKGSTSALFTDSWEIKLNATHKIWTPGFDTSFLTSFGYDIVPFMESGLDSFPDVRYDYMLHLDHYVTEGFYKPYVNTCRKLGAWSRVQCLAAPADVMTLYGLVDIPETEAMLNNPNYSRIVSSSACLASKPMVSCETFTCMYGFPATYLRQEQTADLKMVADALFAQGVNYHIYHGMPYNPQGSDTIDFFATTYFGPGGSLEPDLPAFNTYIEKVSSLLQRGRTYSDIAVYIPYEDGVMQGAYPHERQRVWVWGEYEMRYIEPPGEIKGYHPLWINRHFLEQARWEDDQLVVGDACFSSLYVDVAYMDVRALRRITDLARQGLPVCLKRLPKEPGHIPSGDYSDLLSRLSGYPNVSADLTKVIRHPPLMQGEDMPDYWARVDKDGTTWIFIAQPKSQSLAYPIYSGQSQMTTAETRNISIHIHGKTLQETITFLPYQSLMMKIPPRGRLEYIDIRYTPPDPVVRPREPQKMYF